MKNLIITFLLVLLSFNALADETRIIEFKSDPSGFDTKTYFYVTDKEVVVIDAQLTPALAEESLFYLRKFTTKPITKLIITHPNPDKYNGASVFKKLGAEVISSQATADAIPEVHKFKKKYFVDVAKLFTNENYPTPIPVDVTFNTPEKKLTLKDNDTLILRTLRAPGVSTTQTVVYSPKLNSLFVGDLIHYKTHAWLEGGILMGRATPSITGWIKNLQELLKTYPTNPKVYGGRGNLATLKTAASEQIIYLTKALKITKELITKKRLTAKDLNTDKMKSFYVDLEAKFKKEFPNHSLLYLIQYGSYGVAEDILWNQPK